MAYGYGGVASRDNGGVNISGDGLSISSGCAAA